MKINSPNLLLVASTALIASIFSPNLPAQALIWKINNGIVDPNPKPKISITGNFVIDNESSTSPSVTFSNIMAFSLTFTAADVVNISLATPSGSGINAIDWLNGSDSLSLVFASPLTTAGGTIPLNNTASDFNGDAVSGSVTDVPEPLTILGSGAALGFGSLLAKEYSKIKKKKKGKDGVE
jgi:hypothetical protein